MSSVTRRLGLATAFAIVCFVGRASADDAPPPAPLPDDAAPAPVVRPAPPPVPGPYEPEHRDDTVLGPDMSHGGYGAPSVKVSSLAGDATMLMGAEGGWVIGSAVVLGAAGYTSVTNVVSPTTLQSNAGDARLGISYGGFRLNGLLRSTKRAHLTVGVILGGGAATSENNAATFKRSDTFFVVEPDLGAELNLARHIRLGISGTYRFVGGTVAEGFTPTRLSGPAGALTLRFGSF